MGQEINKGQSLKITMLVTTDLVTDQRVQRHATLLNDMGHYVTLFGREKKNSLPFKSSTFHAIRLRSFFETGWLFYASFNIKLFFKLLLTRSDVIWSNDLDTLLPAYCVSKLRRKVLIYDTHEYFTGVPELEGRPFVIGVWSRLEKYLLPKLSSVFTVNESVAQRYKKEYGVDMTVVRNIPSFKTLSDIHGKDLQSIILPDKPFIIYQGVLNKDRGLEELIAAMQWIEHYALVIVGRGDVEEKLKQQVERLNLSDRIFFLGLLSPHVLKQITPKALVGVSIEKPTNLNYIMCLPNKLFDYIHAGIPVIAYPHPEIKKIIDECHCGGYIDTHDPDKMALQILEMINNDLWLSQCAEFSRAAAAVLNWEEEKKIIVNVVRAI